MTDNLDTSGANDTQLGDVTIFDSAYFDQDYKLQAIWLGLIWFALSVMPQIIYRACRPWWRQGGNLTWGEWHAWRVMLWGNGSAFWVLMIFWLLAYVKAVEDRLMSKIYYRAIAWIIPISWILALWVFIAFLVGGLSTGGEIGPDMGYSFGYWVWTAGFEALAWFLAPRVVKFYKWDQQPWWNYDEDDVPATWPYQLGDFVDY